MAIRSPCWPLLFALLAAVLSSCIKRPGAAVRADAAAAYTCGEGTMCLSDAFKRRVRDADAAMPAWEKKEKNLPYWQKTELQPLLLADTVLKLTNRASEQQTWGYRSLHMSLRRSATFLSYLYPELQTITLLRCDTDHPRPSNPDVSDVHHYGVAADIAIFGTGTGASAQVPLDLERTFWFIWSSLHKENWTDDMEEEVFGGEHRVIQTYYAEELRVYARLAFDAGLIGSAELKRFTGTDIRNTGFNHENHVHIQMPFGNDDHPKDWHP